MSAVPPVPIVGSAATSPSTAFTSARAALFVLTSFLALTFSHAPSSAAIHTGSEPLGGGNDKPQPEDEKDVRRMIAEEQEEELLDEESFGLTVPLGAPRPALIIVMVSISPGHPRILAETMPFCRVQHHGMSTRRAVHFPPAHSFVGSGKSTIGLSLSKALSIPFIDGDSLHPKSNVEKMSKGTPLTDADRLPWLALIRATAERVCREEWVQAERDYAGVGGAAAAADDLAGDASIAEMAEYEFGEGWKWRNAGKDDHHHIRASLGRPAVIIACSALKKWYREILRGNVEAEPPTASDLVSELVQVTAGSILTLRADDRSQVPLRNSLVSITFTKQQRLDWTRTLCIARVARSYWQIGFPSERITSWAHR